MTIWIALRASPTTPTYGLSAYLWTRDVGIVHKLARKIRAGTVQVNGGTGLDPAVPFGGYKQSGLGSRARSRRHRKHAGDQGHRHYAVRLRPTRRSRVMRSASSRPW